MRRAMTLPAVLMLLAWAAPLHAATFGGEVYGQFNTYSMGDWNDAIDAINAFGGTNFDNINNGISGGLAARMWATPNWMFSLGWEPLFASTEDSPSGSKIKLNANAVLLTAGYFFPTPSAGKYGIAAGLGYYHLGGKVEETGYPSADLTGNAIGFHVLGQAEWMVSPGFGVTAGAGYRMAKIGDTKLEGTSATPKLETDYSGFTGRLGLTFYMPTQ